MLPEYNQDFRFATLQENAIQVVGEDDGNGMKIMLFSTLKVQMVIIFLTIIITMETRGKTPEFLI
jgi:hypothetical protein